MNSEELILKDFLEESRSENDQHLDGGSAARLVEDPARGCELTGSPSDDIKPLHGKERTGYYKLGREQLHHREMAMLKAQGFDAVEIADKMGYTKQTVRYTLAQPWMQQLVLEEIVKAGRVGVRELLQAEVIPSIEKLVSVRDSDVASPDVQRKAANDILDRVFGKPNQPISHRDETKDLTQMTDAEIAEELKKLKTTASN